MLEHQLKHHVFQVKGDKSLKESQGDDTKLTRQGNSGHKGVYHKTPLHLTRSGS